MPSDNTDSDNAACPTPKPRKRRGCFSCLATAILLVVVASLVFAAMLYFLFSRPVRDSAWNRLPARTEAAFEISDGGMMAAALCDDPQNAGLLEILCDSMNIRGKWERWALSLLAPLAPKVITCGEVANDRGGCDRVTLIRMPLGTVWLTEWIVNGTGSPEESHGLPWHRLGFAHAAVKDNWLVLTTSEELCRDVCDNWSTPGTTLGVYPPAAAPYILAATKTGSGDNPSFGFSPAMPLMDEYDAQPPGAGLLAVLLTRTANGWLARGRMVPEGGHSGAGDDVSLIPKELAAVPAIELENGFTGVTASVSGRTGYPDFDEPLNGADSFSTWFDNREALAPWRGYPVLELGRFLTQECLVKRHEWAFSASVVFSGKNAAEKGKTGVGAPGTRIGWIVDDIQAVEQAFNRLFPLWFEALTSPGGPSPWQNITRAIGIEAFENPQGNGMVLRLPPGMLDGVRPSCLFIRPDAGAAGSVWLASAPEFAPNEGEAARELLPLNPLIEKRMTVARAAWRLDGACVQKLAHWMETAVFRKAGAFEVFEGNPEWRKLAFAAAGYIFAEGGVVWLDVPERRESYFQMVLPDSADR